MQKKARICTRPSSFNTSLGECASANFQPWLVDTNLSLTNIKVHNKFVLHDNKVTWPTLNKEQGLTFFILEYIFKSEKWKQYSLYESNH